MGNANRQIDVSHYFAEHMGWHIGDFGVFVPTTLREAKDDFLNRRKGARRKSQRSMTFSGTRFRVPPPA